MSSMYISILLDTVNNYNSTMTRLNWPIRLLKITFLNVIKLPSEIFPEVMILLQWYLYNSNAVGMFYYAQWSCFLPLTKILYETLQVIVIPTCLIVSSPVTPLCGEASDDFLGISWLCWLSMLCDYLVQHI